jgi:hypothetical protein
MRFDRQPNESTRAWAAFREYLAMGADRSLAAVAAKIQKRKSQLEKWSVRWSWVERAFEYDAHNARIQSEEENRLMKERAAEWAARQSSLRETEYQTAVALEKKARELLDQPGTTWTVGDCVRALALAAKQRRMACGLPTDSSEISGPNGAPLVSPASVVIERTRPDLKKFTDEELAEYRRLLVKGGCQKIIHNGNGVEIHLPENFREVL